jgi:hypothetical protein
VGGLISGWESGSPWTAVRQSARLGAAVPRRRQLVRGASLDATAARGRLPGQALARESTCTGVGVACSRPFALLSRQAGKQLGERGKKDGKDKVAMERTYIMRVGSAWLKTSGPASKKVSSLFGSLGPAAGLEPVRFSRPIQPQHWMAEFQPIQIRIQKSNGTIVFLAPKHSPLQLPS